jgi:oligopeptide/dipeptide ABC transporter ATP-binding protein
VPLPRDPAPLLRVEGLRKRFDMRGRVRLTALDGVSFELNAGQILGVVGESGSGKSTLAKCLVGLLTPEDGRILYRGGEVGGASRLGRLHLHRAMQLIHQNPHSALNPLMSVGEAIAEPAWVHRLIDRHERHGFAQAMLQTVGLTPELAVRRPGELSGGQCQRVAIARALALRPKALIADEALSALDVAAQAQILELLADLRREQSLAVLLVSHQLPVVARVADRVLVMYLGRVVESGPTTRVLSDPAHPYTLGLLAAQPGAHRRGRRPSSALHGEIPSPLAIPSGCRFRTRCPRAQAICAEADPPRVSLADGHEAWCHLLKGSGGLR